MKDCRTVVRALMLAMVTLGSYAADPAALPESCSGDAKAFWADGKRINVRQCGDLVVLVMADPLNRDPLGFAVGIRNVSARPVEIDSRLFKLMDEAPLDPQKISSRMRRRAAWAAGFAGMSESFGRSSHSTVYGSDGSTATVNTNVPASSAQVNAAQDRAAGPLRNRADAITAQSLKRNTLLPGGGVVGTVYFRQVKKLAAGTLRFSTPDGPVLDFPVSLNAKR